MLTLVYIKKSSGYIFPLCVINVATWFQNTISHTHTSNKPHINEQNQPFQICFNQFAGVTMAKLLSNVVLYHFCLIHSSCQSISNCPSVCLSVCLFKVFPWTKLCSKNRKCYVQFMLAQPLHVHVFISLYQNIMLSTTSFSNSMPVE